MMSKLVKTWSANFKAWRNIGGCICLYMHVTVRLGEECKKAIAAEILKGFTMNTIAFF